MAVPAVSMNHDFPTEHRSSPISLVNIDVYDTLGLVAQEE